MDLRSFWVQVRAYDHAVKYSKFEAQKTAIDSRQAHRDVLMDWNMELDRDNIIAAMGSINGTAYASASEAARTHGLRTIMIVLFGAASNNSGNDHSASLQNVDTTNDKLTPDAIALMKRMAKTASPKIRPIRKKRRSVRARATSCLRQPRWCATLRPTQPSRRPIVKLATVAWIIRCSRVPITSGKTSTSTRSRISLTRSCRQFIGCGSALLSHAGRAGHRHGLGPTSRDG